MAIALTYFADCPSDEALAALLRRREDFYIENIDAMNSLTARMQALLADDGLHSVVRLAPKMNLPARCSPSCSWKPRSCLSRCGCCCGGLPTVFQAARART